MMTGIQMYKLIREMINKLSTIMQAVYNEDVSVDQAKSQVVGVIQKVLEDLS
jgi:hypothetical protein